MIKTAFAYGAVSFLIALAAVPLARSLSFRVGALDYGTGRRVHDGVVPRLGGVGIYFAVALPMLYLLLRGHWEPANYRAMVFILLATVPVFLAGIYDDARSATIRNKLLVEVGAALVAWAGGVRIVAVTDPFGSDAVIRLGWWGLPLTILWIVVITNAINLIDGLDGLAAGTGILIAGTILILTWGKDLPFSLTLVVLMGSLLGFLRYNFPPASVFMGDSGSLVLGFLLASLAVISSSKATAMATLMVPLLAFGYPLLDMGYAVLRRYYRGVPFSRADREHIHHKLLERGLSQLKAVLLLYLVNLAVMGGILLFVRQHFRLRWLVIVVILAVALGSLQLLGYVNLPVFLRRNLHEYRLNRRRRYCGYLVRRFAAASANTGAAELRKHLEALAEGYGMLLLQIEGGGGSDPLLRWGEEGPAGERSLLEFPLTDGGAVVGRVRIEAGRREEDLLCVAELKTALNEVLASRLDILAGQKRGSED